MGFVILKIWYNITKNAMKVGIKMLTIYAISDSIGETAEQIAKASSSQFNDVVEVKRVPYVKNLEDVEEAMKQIEQSVAAIVVSTIITVSVREFLTSRCVEKNITIINVLGPIINTVSSILKLQPAYNPGALRKLDDIYYKRIEAMEFAMQYDDSKDYRGLKNADVVIIGPSRTSKTTLCMYLANKGIKAINIPLMPEVDVPEELYSVGRRKVFSLTINPLHLIEVRKKRLEKFTQGAGNIDYASDARILDELEFCDSITRKVGCRVIDVTERAIEDTAFIICEAIGFGNK